LSETSASPPRDGREGLWAGASHLEAGAVRGLCPGAARRRRGPRLRFAGRRSGALRGERWGVRHGEEGCTRRVALVRSVRRWDRGVDPLGEERRVLRAPQEHSKKAALQTRKRFCSSIRRRPLYKQESGFAAALEDGHFTNKKAVLRLQDSGAAERAGGCSPARRAPSAARGARRARGRAPRRRSPTSGHARARRAARGRGGRSSPVGGVEGGCASVWVAWRP